MINPISISNHNAKSNYQQRKINSSVYDNQSISFTGLFNKCPTCRNFGARGVGIGVVTAFCLGVGDWLSSMYMPFSQLDGAGKVAFAALNLIFAGMTGLTLFPGLKRVFSRNCLFPHVHNQ